MKNLISQVLPYAIVNVLVLALHCECWSNWSIVLYSFSLFATALILYRQSLVFIENDKEAGYAKFALKVDKLTLSEKGVVQVYHKGYVLVNDLIGNLVKSFSLEEYSCTLKSFLKGYFVVYVYQTVMSSYFMALLVFNLTTYYYFGDRAQVSKLQKVTAQFEQALPIKLTNLNNKLQGGKNKTQ